jgi:hypothetical protein
MNEPRMRGDAGADHEHRWSPTQREVTGQAHGLPSTVRRKNVVWGSA